VNTPTPGVLSLVLPLHHDDGHRHLFPLLDWRFESPISYWDPAHYGKVFGPADAALAIVCCALLWRRTASRTGRAVLALVVLGAFVGGSAPWLTVT
jgi:hypothetical protein